VCVYVWVRAREKETEIRIVRCYETRQDSRADVVKGYLALQVVLGRMPGVADNVELSCTVSGHDARAAIAAEADCGGTVYTLAARVQSEMGLTLPFLLPNAR
jgi:hypothetical protein